MIRAGRWAPLLALASGSFACTQGPEREVPDTPPPPAVIERSLVWTRADLLDDPSVAGLARVMAAFSDDAHGGARLEAWFESFATTPHSARYGPSLLLDDVRSAQGTDPAQWDLDLLPFRATAVHNRIDLLAQADGGAPGHCGELRVSFASDHPVQQPIHLLFLFRQPAGPEDIAEDGTVHCEGTARRWAELSGVADAAFLAAARALLDDGLVPSRALLAESLEQTVSPWEWRQWTFDGAPANPPLFQTVDVERLNQPGADRDEFLAWVEQNAEALSARRMPIPPAYRPPSARAASGVPRPTLDLTGLDPAVLAAWPDLRAQIEIVGCPACHTADAEFVQTRPDRTFSPFYEKELEARRAFLDQLANGSFSPPPFGPLQAGPVLPE